MLNKVINVLHFFAFYFLMLNIQFENSIFSLLTNDGYKNSIPLHKILLTKEILSYIKKRVDKNLRQNNSTLL